MLIRLTVPGTIPTVASPVQVVCLAVGEGDHALYLTRLQSMLRRHMPCPFTLSCLADRSYELPPEIRPIDLSGWTPPRTGMRPTAYKLGLYSRERMPFDEFLYLDTSLVIHRDMTPLLAFAAGRPEELVAVQDWTYDAYNTSVMRIRPGRTLAGISQGYDAGADYVARNRGDQDFATGMIRDRGWTDHVATFPEGMVASYKGARKQAKRDRRAAQAALDRAIIVKFHGEPKMHQLLDPRYRLRQMIARRRPWHRDAWFWVRELRDEWR